VHWKDDEDPGLPIKFGPCSNGEYDPEPLSPVITEAIRRAREECERNARRLGMGRREFLLSSMAAATTLLTLDACTREALRARTGRRASPGGTFVIPSEATTEPSAAASAVGGEEFILDVQGHLLEYDVNPGTGFGADFYSRFPQQKCGESDPRICFDIQHFMTELFLRSDTTMAVLSALPIAPERSPLSPEIMNETRLVAERLCHDERILLHAQVLPNIGRFESTLAAMGDRVGRFPVKAWKVFTHYPDLFTHRGDGWWLDDHERGVPKVGQRFIEHAVALGVPRIAAHKGLSSGSRFASPEDIGPAARRNPDARFLVYHSGFETSVTEGPYTRATKDVGVNRLIASLRESGIGPNENVYAELGSTWWYVMRTPTQAAHVLGKLLKFVGEDRVIWGTDSIFYGSPQDQIQALRAFYITPEYQERYGYPALTKEIKRKIFGANAAALYAVDPITVPCQFTRGELEHIRRQIGLANSTYGPTTKAEVMAFHDHHQGWP
jgi:predicted TIM-barrel fold metal-dependent hydrolase